MMKLLHCTSDIHNQKKNSELMENIRYEQQRHNAIGQ